MGRFNSFNCSTLKDIGRHKIAFFLFFVFCILAVSIIFFVLSIGKPFIGIDLVLNKQGWAVANIDTNGIANQAGIKEGDRPIEVNNLPAQTFLEAYKEPGVVYGMLISQLTVVDSTGQMKSAAINGVSSSRSALIVQWSMFFVCLIFWITGFYVLQKAEKCGCPVVMLSWRRCRAHFLFQHGDTNSDPDCSLF